MEDVLSLVSDFFAGVNHLLPLYHEETFMKQLYENASGASESAGWLASINTVLALGHISRMRGTFIPQEQEKEAWKYMKNAMAIQSELPALDFDLLSVQALIGMTIFLLITSCNSQMPSMMLATAIRVAQGIGLHINCDDNDPRTSEIDKEQRRRVFWIAYIFDRELSLRTGRAPVQSDTDTSVPLPSTRPPAGFDRDPTPAGHFGAFNLFRARARFAQLQSAIYKRLYSDAAWARPRGAVLEAVGALDRDLEDWRVSLPAELRPDAPMTTATMTNLPPPPYDSSVLVLHFCYWFAYGLVHRRHAICINDDNNIIGGGGDDDWSATAAQNAVSSPPTTTLPPPGQCVATAARRTVALLERHPPGAKGTRWYLLYYCAAALVSLFGRVVGDAGSSNSECEADLKRMRVALGFMTGVCEEVGGDSRDARNMLGVCRKMEGIAVGCLEKAAMAAMAKGEDGGGQGEEEEERRRRRGEREREKEVLAIQRQLRVHGTFLSPMDV
ncbi:putative transcriptional regulatory protein [Diplodia seriata]|uniref:Putative transcriptional regulatory protein n=1 Tax=Diplodia seriata TaxID=420778 RepID=A0A1S8B4X0_9PEZI|nr:putative transcriptional regulatory protein [Diplodia seriata]